MATRATKSGFAAEAKAKMDSKYDAGLAADTMQWIKRTLDRAGTGCDIKLDGSQESVHECLGDGTTLCSLANALEPGAISSKKISTSKMAFKQMENISQFLTWCEKYGVPKTELFQTVDLYEKQNLVAVLDCLNSLGRKVNAKGGDGIGPKEATANKRDFTEEQLKSGQSIIGLQMGSNKGASQAGQNFGKARMIVD